MFRKFAAFHESEADRDQNRTGRYGVQFTIFGARSRQNFYETLMTNLGAL